jgi:hypothetical protein
VTLDGRTTQHVRMQLKADLGREPGVLDQLDYFPAQN